MKLSIVQQIEKLRDRVPNTLLKFQINVGDIAFLTLFKRM